MIVLNLCKDTQGDCRKLGGGVGGGALTSINIVSLQIHWSLDFGGKCW